MVPSLMGVTRTIDLATTMHKGETIVMGIMEIMALEENLEEVEEASLNIAGHSIEVNVVPLRG